MSLVELFFKSLFVDNLALSFGLGIFSFYSIGGKIKNAFWLGSSLLALLIAATITNNLIYQNLLAKGALYWASESLDLAAFSFICYVLLVITYLKIGMAVFKRYIPVFHEKIAAYTVELSVSCAVLGSSLVMTERLYSLSEATVWSLGAGLGWFLVLLIFAAVQEKLKYSAVPRGLQGGGIFFVTLGLIALIFMGFSSLFFA